MDYVAHKLLCVTVIWSGILYGDVKKLVHVFRGSQGTLGSSSFTLYSYNVESTQLSQPRRGRISYDQSAIDLVKITIGIIDSCYNLLTTASSNEENQNNTQAPNQDSQDNNNLSSEGSRESTASTGGPMPNQGPSDKRNRSHRSSGPSPTKGDSINRSVRTGKMLRNPKVVSHKVTKDLLSTYHNNGKYNGIIRLLDQSFLQSCYSLIKSKPGNMTKGTSQETLDSINEKWFTRTAEDLLTGRFRFKPLRQVMIPKANKPGEFRQLLIADPRDKIVQKALEVLLNGIFEGQFSNASHGFRPNRSVKTALDVIHMRGGHMAWVINGDITKCFDSIPHYAIMGLLSKYISDVRFLTMIERSLKSGIITKQGKLIKTTVGTPQGSILSPLLANIVLNELDKYIESLELNKGTKRRTTSRVMHLENQRKYYKVRDPAKAKAALMELRVTPRKDMQDPNFRRALYVRYADDFVVLMAAPLVEVMALKTNIAKFLSENCGLELNESKTTVNSTRKGFNFLGASIKRRTNVSIFNNFRAASGNRITRRSTLRMAVDMPTKSIIGKLIENGFARRNHLQKVLAKGKTNLVHLTHYDILSYFNSKVRGLLAAYSFAGNYSSMHHIT